jgi:hypothetical protein
MRMLGIEHPMTWDELYESIPPAYTEHIGRALLQPVTVEPVGVLF